jgi:hypothetical protein
MQSCFILCFYKVEDAEKCFDVITDYYRTHKAPVNFYIERANYEGMPVPYAVAVLFHQAHIHKIDNELCKIPMRSSDDIYSGVLRVIEHYERTRQIKVQQFWKGQMIVDDAKRLDKAMIRKKIQEAFNPTYARLGEKFKAGHGEYTVFEYDELWNELTDHQSALVQLIHSSRVKSEKT